MPGLKSTQNENRPTYRADREKGYSMDSIKKWAITYQHPTTGEIVKSHKLAVTKAQATEQARKANARDPVSGRLWKILSVELCPEEV